DAETAFSGGTIVTDAAAGTRSRQVSRGAQLAVPQLSGLRRGRPYVLTFFVKPLQPVATVGVAGGPDSRERAAAPWRAVPAVRWQRIRLQVIAAAAAEPFGFVVEAGAAAVRIDGVEVRPGVLTKPEGAARPTFVGRKFVADDTGSVFFGGRIVHGGGARGRTSRELAPGEPMEIPLLRGLVRGRTYAVSFWAKPLSQRASGTLLLATTRAAAAGWAVSGRRWQRIRLRLVAGGVAGRLAISNAHSQGSVLIDGVSIARLPVVKSIVLAATAVPVPKPGFREELPPILRQIWDGFNKHDTTGSNANASWRFAIWGFMLRRTLHDPAFGVGFGRPTHFLWHGVLFDARLGDASNPNDETGPHNSFVDLIFRTGLLGFIPLVVLVAAAFLRLRTSLRERRDDRPLLAALIGVAAIFVFVSIVASLNVVLEGPYMGIFFWIALGLLLILPVVAPERPPSAAATPRR
ncbi:MAG: O-antigen ligase family protein, partial [Gaiellaceae bacterium]